MNGNDHNTNPEAGNAGAYGAGASGAGTYGTGTSGSEYREEGTYPSEGTYSSASAEAGQQYAQTSGQGYTSQQNYAGQPGSAPYDPYASNPNAGPGYPPPYGYAPPPPAAAGSANPGLAALLGFIPGVGAMYNGQFVKGIAHIVIFSVLTSVSSHAHDPLDVLVGLLSAGWYFYMVFDAYQTARARRDGLVAPDPFGLNTLGERMGLPVNPNWNDFVARPQNANAAQDATARANASSANNPYTAAPVDPSTGAPTAGPVPPYAPYTPPYAAPGSNPYAAPGNPYAAPGSPYPAPGAPYAYAEPAPGYAAPFGAPPYGGTYAPQVPPAAPFNPGAPTRSGLPVGAIWLIGLGLIALIGSLGHSFYWSGRYIGGLILILLGAGFIAQRAFAAKDFYPTGTAAHRWYLLHQSRVGILLIVVGVLSLLNTLGFAYWHHSWPYLLILFGLLQVADRAAYNQMLAEGPIQPLGSTFVPPAVPVDTPANGTNGTSGTNGTTEQEVR